MMAARNCLNRLTTRTAVLMLLAAALVHGDDPLPERPAGPVSDVGPVLLAADELMPHQLEKESAYAWPYAGEGAGVLVRDAVIQQVAVGPERYILVTYCAFPSAGEALEGAQYYSTHMAGVFERGGPQGHTFGENCWFGPTASGFGAVLFQQGRYCILVSSPWSEQPEREAIVQIAARASAKVATALTGREQAPMGRLQAGRAAVAHAVSIPVQARLQDAIQRLQAAEEQTRRGAKEEILQIYGELVRRLPEGAEVSDLPEYQQIVDGLIAIVSKERLRYQDFDEKFLAVQLLGELRAARAVDVLLDNILFRPPGRITETIPRLIYPCVGALIRIGEPSTVGVLQRLDSEYEESMVTRLYAIVIRDVEGREPGEALLESELEKARTRQANIAGMLTHFAPTIRRDDPQEPGSEE